MDIYAIHTPNRSGKSVFTCHVSANSERHACKIANAAGIRTPRGSYAIRIGLDGYARALASTMSRQTA
jgi:hypothetical protein